MGLFVADETLDFQLKFNLFLSRQKCDAKVRKSIDLKTKKKVLCMRFFFLCVTMIDGELAHRVMYTWKWLIIHICQKRFVFILLTDLSNNRAKHTHTHT